MGAAKSAYEAGLSPEAAAYKIAVEAREQMVDRGLNVWKAAFQQLKAHRLNDQSLASPLLDADDIESQNADILSLVAEVRALADEAEAFATP